MKLTFICYHCKLCCRRNLRCKSQLYCGKKECQSARKKAWEYKKLSRDPSYRLRKKASQAKWRKKYPLHEYQKEYRLSHAEYAEHNREKQIVRNKRSELSQKTIFFSKIVKMDTLKTQHAVNSKFDSHLYMLVDIHNIDVSNIVKMDALILEFPEFETLSSSILLKAVDCKDGHVWI